MPHISINKTEGTARSSTKRPTVLILLDYYLPGYKSGGPLRAIAGLTEALGDEIDFRILTSDRDIGDRRPYPGIARNHWVQLGKASVCYIDRRNIFSLVRRVLQTPHDALYMKSFFSRPFSMLPMWMQMFEMLHSRTIILAPAGEFSVGAIALKKRRKKLYIAVCRRLAAYRRTIWHATSELEALDIKRELGGVQTVTARSLGSYASGNRSPQVFIASELARLNVSDKSPINTNAKMPGQLRLGFISRISRKKNLHGALKMLTGLQGDVSFEIYGPLEDESYWRECQRLITELTPNIRVSYRGAIPHQAITSAMKSFDLFYFPTLGENFGYVILEALSSGCPVLLSDQTPWRNLPASTIGWDIPLDKPDQFRTVLQHCIDMTDEEHRLMCERALEFGLRHSQDAEVVSRNRALFHTALSLNRMMP
jgi:glycosyltransferase involved in cell wall biosynthesis